MSKFKVGDKVVCIETNQEECDVNGIVHGMTYVVEYIEKYGPEEEWLLCFGDSSAFAKRFKLVEEPGQNMVAQALIKETEMTAEQIRNEILRIDTRIEEAKKDIENAEKERNCLVEKLREKGFEIASQHKLLPLLDSPFLEINAEYVINERNNSTWMEKGTKVICTDIDPSSRKLDAKVEDSEGNDDWVNSECLTKI